MSELDILLFGNKTVDINEKIVADKNYSNMLSHISDTLPAIQKDSANFYKTDSQFKNVTLDVTELTPISALKHILAVIEKTKQAIQHNGFSMKKGEIVLRQKKEEVKTAIGFEKELLELEILQLETETETNIEYMKGALRKLNFFVTQYESIMKQLDKTHLTEEDYELNEERHHIMTAMKQALISARPRGGVIDEGNQIYLFDMGINGAVAQEEVLSYLNKEVELLSRGETPTFEMTMEWLNHCVDRFMGSGRTQAKNKGLVSLDESSLVKELSYDEESY